jgi:succinate dehydrogenase / fumarate reductase, cytochrome b subunit
MSWVTQFAKSSVGAKVIMGLTGFILFGFVLVHMLGNLQMFLGADAINSYAAFLQSNLELLWPARIVLLVAVLLHIWAGIRLSWLNQTARPEAYQVKKWRKASWTSRTMMWTGLTLLAFIIYHLLHFTLGIAHPDSFHLVDAQGRHDVYAMMVYSFQNLGISLSYIVAMIFLGLHLNHGASSMFQSLGLNSSKYNCTLRAVGPVFSIVIVLGNISMPIAVLLGWVTVSGG